MISKKAVEVGISFDTTGSMYPCLTQVRREVTNLVKELFTEIPDLKIGIMAHGDYCDESCKTSYVIKQLPLTSNKESIISFINNCGNTSGGDAAECYELVLHEARSFKWTTDVNKIFLLIGDDVPHSKNESQNYLNLDWKNELNSLVKLGVKVAGVQALSRGYATSFYETISNASGGSHLTLNQFSEVGDLIRAVCYQQSGGNDQLDQFYFEIQKSGKMTCSMDNIFNSLKGIKKDTSTRSNSKTSASRVPDYRFQALNVEREILALMNLLKIMV